MHHKFNTYLIMIASYYANSFLYGFETLWAHGTF